MNFLLLLSTVYVPLITVLQQSLKPADYYTVSICPLNVMDGLLMTSVIRNNANFEN